MCPKNLRKLFDGRSNIRCGTKTFEETWSGCVEYKILAIIQYNKITALERYD